MHKKIQIIFDMDGVLLRSDKLYVEIAASLFSREISSDEMSSYVTKGGSDLFAAVIGDEISEEKVALFRQAQIDYFDPSKHLYDGVVDILRLLNEHYELSILSNKPERVIREILKKCDLDGIFQSVIGLGSGFKRKPAPDGAKFLMETSKCSKSIFVGDAYSDWLTANRAEIEFIYAKYGFDTHKKSHLIEMTEFSQLINILNHNFHK